MKTILQKLLITILAVGTFSLASAEEMFIFQTTEVKIDNKKGTLYIGTPVNVIKNVDDKNVLVEFSGVVFEDKLFTNKDKSLLMASIDKNSFGIKGEVKKVQAVIEKGNLSIVPSEIWEEHEEFFYETCTQCHAAHKSTEHSMLEWDAILQTMSGFAQLYPDEAEYLSRYLKANSNNGFYPEKK
ncbi:MAG: hypothetical protein ACEQSQ_04705 [Candidatus Paceibacteria bacterium]|jgi:trimethylamine-N-oxide reductase cytochrome c-type subunit TorC